MRHQAAAPEIDEASGDYILVTGAKTKRTYKVKMIVHLLPGVDIHSLH